MTTIDPTTRYGYIPGRCGAHCKHGGLCRQWPMQGAKRCRRHGGRGNNGGWKTGNRKNLTPRLGKPNKTPRKPKWGGKAGERPWYVKQQPIPATVPSILPVPLPASSQPEQALDPILPDSPDYPI